MNACSFCNFQVRTECYIDERTSTGLVVVRDENPKGYDIRLLAVIAKPEAHRHQPTLEQKRLLERGLVRAYETLRGQFVVADKDYTQMEYPHHYHCQWCLRRRD